VILSAKHFVPDTTCETLYVKSRPTPLLAMKKILIWKAHYVFHTQIKIPL